MLYKMRGSTFCIHSKILRLSFNHPSHEKLDPINILNIKLWFGTHLLSNQQWLQFYQQFRIWTVIEITPYRCHHCLIRNICYCIFGI
jgi:hypothetical protein